MQRIDLVGLSARGFAIMLLYVPGLAACDPTHDEVAQGLEMRHA